VLQDQAADILHTVQAQTTYEDIVGAHRDCFGKHQLVAPYRSQLTARVKISGEILQEFATAMEQQAHRAIVRLSVALIQTETFQASDRI